MAKETIVEEELPVELTDAEKKKIEREARDEVAVQLKKAKAAAYKEQMLKQANAESLFRHAQNEKGESIVEIDLSYIPSFPKHIILDGTVYTQRKAPYKVTAGKAAVLRELLARGEEQEQRRLPPEEGEARKEIHERRFRLSQKGLKQVV